MSVYTFHKKIIDLYSQKKREGHTIWLQTLNTKNRNDVRIILPAEQWMPEVVMSVVSRMGSRSAADFTVFLHHVQ